MTFTMTSFVLPLESSSSIEKLLEPLWVAAKTDSPLVTVND
jgi:hypothetical protein